MAKRSGNQRKGAGGESKSARIRALERSQQINDMLKRSLIESEALQSSGDDMPAGQDHISSLLEEDAGDRKMLKNVEHAFEAEGRTPSGARPRPKPRSKSIPRKKRAKKTKRRG